MSVTICIAANAPVKGTNAIKNFMLVCGHCNAYFMYNHEASIRPKFCKRCGVKLPRRLKYFAGYYTARTKYHSDNK